MIILDGKADAEAFEDLLPHIIRAGRLDQLRLINPCRPDISVGYNPFQSNGADYMSVVNMVFGAFNLHREFFAEHQLNLSLGHRSRAELHRAEIQLLRRAGHGFRRTGPARTG